MSKLLTFFFAVAVIPVLQLSAVLAGAGSVIEAFPPGVFQSRAAIDAPSALPGHPTLTYETTQSASGSGAGPWTTSGLSAGSAFANRRVYHLIVVGQSGLVISGTPTIGGVNCDVVVLVGNTDASIFLLSAPVPTGTTADLSLNFTTSNFQIMRVSSFATDKTTLVSATPTTSFATASSGTSLANSISVSAGSAVLAGFEANQITNGTQSISSSSPTFTQNNISNSFFAGSVNAAPAGTASITIGWTTATTGGALGLMALR